MIAKLMISNKYMMVELPIKSVSREVNIRLLVYNRNTFVYFLATLENNLTKTWKKNK